MLRWALLAFLAAVASARPAVAGVDDLPPAFEGPYVVEVGSELAVIVDGQGDVTMAADAAQRLRVCEETPGCGAFWEDGVGAVVIVDQSPAPASPPPSGPASKGATPR